MRRLRRRGKRKYKMRPDEKLTTKEEFLSSLFEIWDPQPQAEMIPVEESEGRILAEDQFARYDLPVVRASRFDGIAVKSAAFADGMPDTSSWKLGEDFVRADTGDDFDDAYDAVIMIEQVNIHPDIGVDIHLRPDQNIESGSNVSPKGSQLAKGTLVAHKGFTLNPVSISSIIRGGITEIPVIKRPRVGYIPTGSELVAAGTAPARGQNINSNAALVEGLIRTFGGVPTIYDIVPDDMQMLSDALDKATRENDIVLMSGGSSKGEEDFTTRLFEQHSKLLTHQVRSVPGRPMSVAIDGDKPLINLSGPSAAALNGMLWCVNAVIARFMGRKPYSFPKEKAILSSDMRVPGKMELLHTLMLHRAEDGILRAEVAGRSLAANGFYITSLGEDPKSAGDTIEVSLLCPPSDY